MPVSGVVTSLVGHCLVKPSHLCLFSPHFHPFSDTLSLSLYGPLSREKARRRVDRSSKLISKAVLPVAHVSLVSLFTSICLSIHPVVHLSSMHPSLLPFGVFDPASPKWDSWTSWQGGRRGGNTIVMVTYNSWGQQSWTAGLSGCRDDDLPALALGWGQRSESSGSWDQEKREQGRVEGRREAIRSES